MEAKRYFKISNNFEYRLFLKIIYSYGFKWSGDFEYKYPNLRDYYKSNVFYLRLDNIKMTIDDFPDYPAIYEPRDCKDVIASDIRAKTKKLNEEFLIG